MALERSNARNSYEAESLQRVTEMLYDAEQAAAVGVMVLRVDHRLTRAHVAYLFMSIIVSRAHNVYSNIKVVNSNADDESGERIAELLMHSKTIRGLHLINNHFSEKTFAAVARALLVNRSLTHLTFTQCNFQSVSLKDLLRSAVRFGPLRPEDRRLWTVHQCQMAHVGDERYHQSDVDVYDELLREVGQPQHPSMQSLLVLCYEPATEQGRPRRRREYNAQRYLGY